MSNEAYRNNGKWQVHRKRSNASMQECNIEKDTGSIYCYIQKRIQSNAICKVMSTEKTYILLAVNNLL